MGTLALPTIELVSTLRTAPQNGSISSDDYNDSWTESLADSASLSDFINDTLIPILNGLNTLIQTSPTTTPNGLEGRFIFSDTTDSTSLFFDSLSNNSLTLADSLRVLNGVLTTTQTSVNSLSSQVVVLQSQLATTNQNDLSQALNNFSSSLQTASAQITSNTQQISVLQGQVAATPYSGVIQRVQTQHTILSGDVTNGYLVTNTWPSTFADTNYSFENSLVYISGAPVWQSSHTYAVNNIIVDSNGNLQIVTAQTGNSGSSHPTWGTTPGSTTTDNSNITWTFYLPLGQVFAAYGKTTGAVISVITVGAHEAGFVYELDAVAVHN